MTDHTTQPLTEEELDAIQQRTDTHGRGLYGYVINDIEYQGNWVHDIHRLLGEVDRLRAENTALAGKVAAADAKVAEWDLSDEQIELLSQDISPVRRAEKWLKLTSYRVCAQSLRDALDDATAADPAECTRCSTTLVCQRCRACLYHCYCGGDQDGGDR